MDMWSLGVLVWEVAAAATPDLVAQEAVAASGSARSGYLSLLERGRRLTVDEGWPAPIRSLLGVCWLEDPAARPTFQMALALLWGGEGVPPGVGQQHW